MARWRDGDGTEHQAEDAGVRRIAATRAGLNQPFAVLAGLSWYAILVRAGTERVVEALLERRGFLAVVPVRRYWRRLNRHVQRKTEICVPIAPRYVFVGFAAGDMVRGAPPWGEVFAITMVTGVVGVGEVPWRMRGDRVARFVLDNLDVAPGPGEEHMRPHREFAVGDEVTVVAGSLAGLRARVHAINGREARVLLPLFGRKEQEFALRVADLDAVE